MADAGFPRRQGGGEEGAAGANPWEVDENILSFGKVFAENCMEMKEIGPRG